MYEEPPTNAIPETVPIETLYVLIQFRTISIERVIDSRITFSNSSRVIDN